MVGPLTMDVKVNLDDSALVEVKKLADRCERYRNALKDIARSDGDSPDACILKGWAEDALQIGD